MSPCFRSLLALSVTLLLANCAAEADHVKAAYVSPLQYQDYSCKQIRAELMRVSRKVNEVSGVQDKTASNDSVAMGVGLILFWPSLFFISGSDSHVELAQLKGEFDALEQAAITKDCAVEKELTAAREAEQARKDQKQQQQTNARRSTSNQ